MRQLADGFVGPAAQFMNPDGSFTDLMMKIQSDQPIAVPFKIASPHESDLKDPTVKEDSATK